MLRYEEFEQFIRDETGDEFLKWKHIYPAVPVFYRSRFLLALRSNFSIPRCHDLVLLSYKMDEQDFSLFVEQVKAVEQPDLLNDTLTSNN